jgi:hypothetical protein
VSALKPTVKAMMAMALMAALPAMAADDITARKNFGAELAGCAAYYEAGASQAGLSEQARSDLSQKSLTALQAAAMVTDNRYAMTKEAEARSKPTVSGATCEKVMAEPNERFRYWRSR